MSQVKSSIQCRLTRLIATALLALWTTLSFSQVPTNPTRTGEILPAPPGSLSTLSLPSSAVTNTLVGPGDVLRITIFGQPDLSAEIGVNDKGIINLPLIGGMDVNNMNTSDVAKKIADSYREQKFLINPEVSVETIQLRSQMVSILGEVQQPGRYPIPGRLTVLELLATAGGLTQEADTTVTVLRLNPDNSGQDMRIPIRLGQTGDAERNHLDVTLRSGDVVYVNKKQLFYIHGEVNRPGAYPMEADMNVMRAISIGGGLTQRASDRRIRIFRKNQEIGVTMKDSLQPGDVVLIKQSLF